MQLINLVNLKTFFLYQYLAAISLNCLFFNYLTKFYKICFKMLVKNVVKWFSLTIFLFFNFITNNQVLADSGPQPPPPIASTNVSTVSAVRFVSGSLCCRSGVEPRLSCSLSTQQQWCAVSAAAFCLSKLPARSVCNTIHFNRGKGEINKRFQYLKCQENHPHHCSNQVLSSAARQFHQLKNCFLFLATLVVWSKVCQS